MDWITLYPSPMLFSNSLFLFSSNCKYFSWLRKFPDVQSSCRNRIITYICLLNNMYAIISTLLKPHELSVLTSPSPEFMYKTMV